MASAPSPAAALLAPGAGSDRHHPSLLAIDAALAPLPVERMDFPYRRQGAKAPDRAPVLVAAVVEAASALARGHRLDPTGLVLGGRSMGGRICSMAVAEGLPAAGLVLVSYPLHPPGRPDRLRTAHLPRIRVPCLFVSGTRDAFATPAELEAAAAAIPAPVELVWVEGGRHELKGAEQAVATAVGAWVRALGPPAMRPRG
ncbi:MAG: dienelactone hydrolase [Actinomycetota bacterium]|nr:dienelactone hydrolase [Actinomycetota bacterium]